ncbi:unnamed protein product [Moneuplotes crassus]|uniref:Uncharacterized protein n=1 Tax=Euplotes crassus TaxID=5936 RepID=A0AAD1U0F1_EUPCR|nr:unnamed protein product [Moneuplotes crassus]
MSNIKIPSKRIINRRNINRLRKNLTKRNIFDKILEQPSSLTALKPKRGLFSVRRGNTKRGTNSFKGTLSNPRKKVLSETRIFMITNCLKLVSFTESPL